MAALFFGCNSPKLPLRVGLLVWPAYELPYLAAHLGMYDGQPIQLVEYSSPAEVLRAYSSGGLDAIAVTIDYALQLAARDSAQRIIMAIDFSNGGDALLSKPEIDSLQGLQGARVGIERSVLGAFVLRRALDYAGLTKGQVTVESVDLPDTVAAYARGHLDAVVTYEPYLSQIKDLGARELFSSRDIPGEIIDVLISDCVTIDRYEEEFAVLISGWLQAGVRLEQEPLLSAQFLASRENTTPKAFLAMVDGIELMSIADNREFLAGAEPAILPALRRQVEILLEEGWVSSLPDLGMLVDGRFFEDRGP